MKGLAKLICLMAIFGVTACQEVVPTSRATDSTAANPTSTPTGVESSPKSKSVDLDYSQEPEPRVTVSVNPVAIATNLRRGLEELPSSDVANRATDTVQSLAKEKAEAIEQVADSARQIEQEPARFRATDNSLPQVDEFYTYHRAQPDPNLPPVEAIPCDDPGVVSNPKQVCQFSSGVIRMPRLDK
jgi:hypothetical protein